VSSRKVGWADDIDAPRQEINTLSLLYEEFEIQRILKAADRLEPDTILDAYRDARTKYRSAGEPVEVNVKRTDQLSKQVALFGAQACARARNQGKNRGMITCICPDQPGVLARLSARVAAAGGNIEGGLMSIVAGHLVTVFLVSGFDSSSKPADSPTDLHDDYLELEAEDIDWPRPDSIVWHARARGPADGSLLLGITDEIGNFNLPLITMSSWREPEAGSSGTVTEVVDLNFAIVPDPDQSEHQTIADLEKHLHRRIVGVQLEVIPMPWPTQLRPEGEVGGTVARDVVVTIVGHARPGFVRDILRTLAEEVSEVVDIRGSSMALLEGRSVVTVVFTRAARSSISDLTHKLRTLLRRRIQQKDDKARLMPIQVVAMDRSPLSRLSGIKSHERNRNPTNELSLQVPEQSRVVVKVAELLAKHDVNITWFMSRVREPIVGERWPICDIQMHLHVPPGKYEEVNAALRTLTELEGWGKVRLHAWSLGR
jgi:glycine cleavage system regulatory protein